MIVTAINNNDFYFEQLRVMLWSLMVNSPEDKVFVHMIDFTEKTLEKLRRIYKNTEFVDPEVSVKNKNDIAGFMVCYRGKIIIEAMEKFKEPIAWFDTDLIIRKPLDGLWADLKENSLKIKVRRPTEKDKQKWESDPNYKNRFSFQAGIFCLGYSKNTLEYATEWGKEIQKKNNWYEDQLQLYLKYEKYKEKIDLIELPFSYNDVGNSEGECFLQDSHIWHCKKSHFENPIFKKEFEKHKREADKLWKQ